MAETPDNMKSDLMQDPAHLRADVRMAIRALRQGWITPDDSRIRTYLKLQTADLIRKAAGEKKVNIRRFRALVKLYAELEHLALDVMKAETASLSIDGAMVGSEKPVKRIITPPIYGKQDGRDKPNP